MSSPQITVFSPTPGDVLASGSAISFLALVSDDIDAATDLTLSWSSNLDGVFSTQGAIDATGVVTESISSLSVGIHVMTVTVTNLGGFSSDTSKAFRVNALPSAPVVEISPAVPGPSDSLTAVVTTVSTDPDGNLVTYRYSWYKDAVLSPDSITAVLPAASTARGETWRVVVTPNDGFHDGPTGEDSVIIPNPDVGIANICTLTGTFMDAGGDFLSGVHVRFSPDLETSRLTGVGFVADDITAASNNNGEVSFSVVRGLVGLLAISGTDLVRRVTIPNQGTVDIFELSSTGLDLLEVQELTLIELPRRS
jgi:hypothetical protein